MEMRMKENAPSWSASPNSGTQQEETKYRMSSANHAETVLINIQKLWEQESGLDVTLVAQDRHIRAHRLVIRAASTYFCKNLPKDSSKEVYIMLPNVEFEYLEYMVQFIYNGQVTIPQSKMNTFVNMANEFGLINPNQTQQNFATSPNNDSNSGDNDPNGPVTVDVASLTTTEPRRDNYESESPTPVIENVSSLAELTFEEESDELVPSASQNGGFQGRLDGSADAYTRVVEKKCPLCQRGFTTPHGFAKHYKSCKKWREGMGSEMKLTCPTCPQVFNSKSSFYYHMRTSKCKNLKVPRVPVAARKMAKAKSLSANVHCSFCNYKTFSRKGLKIHLGHRHRKLMEETLTLPLPAVPASATAPTSSDAIDLKPRTF